MDERVNVNNKVMHEIISLCLMFCKSTLVFP